MTGFLLVDKPPGPTSHDVVDTARRALRTRRVGHAGTLDPPASGLLVLGVGAATRLLRFVQGLPKTYEATGVLGVRTSTLDADGEIVSAAPADVQRPQLEGAAARFVGEIEQVPPAVSAVKVGGKRAYALARAGEEVEIQPRRVEVHALEIVSFEPPEFGLEVRCSSGTYIRSLVADIGDALGPGAHVKSLRRTAIGSLRAEEGCAPAEIMPEKVIEVADGLRDLRRVDLGPDQARRARWGQQVEAETDPGEVLVCGPDGPVGVFTAAAGRLRPLTVLPAGDAGGRTG